MKPAAAPCPGFLLPLSVSISPLVTPLCFGSLFLPLPCRGTADLPCLVPFTLANSWFLFPLPGPLLLQPCTALQCWQSRRHSVTTPRPQAALQGRALSNPFCHSTLILRVPSPSSHLCDRWLNTPWCFLSSPLDVEDAEQGWVGAADVGFPISREAWRDLQVMEQLKHPEGLCWEFVFSYDCDGWPGWGIGHCAPRGSAAAEISSTEPLWDPVPSSYSHVGAGQRGEQL